MKNWQNCKTKRSTSCSKSVRLKCQLAMRGTNSDLHYQTWRNAQFEKKSGLFPMHSQKSWEIRKNDNATILVPHQKVREHISHLKMWGTALSTFPSTTSLRIVGKACLILCAFSSKKAISFNTWRRHILANTQNTSTNVIVSLWCCAQAYIISVIKQNVDWISILRLQAHLFQLTLMTTSLFSSCSTMSETTLTLLEGDSEQQHPHLLGQ